MLMWPGAARHRLRTETLNLAAPRSFIREEHSGRYTLKHSRKHVCICYFYTHSLTHFLSFSLSLSHIQTHSNTSLARSPWQRTRQRLKQIFSWGSAYDGSHTWRKRRRRKTKRVVGSCGHLSESCGVRPMLHPEKSNLQSAICV